MSSFSSLASVRLSSSSFGGVLLRTCGFFDVLTGMMIPRIGPLVIRFCGVKNKLQLPCREIRRCAYRPAIDSKTVSD